MGNENKREAYDNYQPGPWGGSQFAQARRKADKESKEPGNVGQGVSVSGLFGVDTPSTKIWQRKQETEAASWQ